MVPTGFRFCPTDEELIQILHHKASGNPSSLSFDFILETNVYGFEPQHLPWSESVGLSKNERYYYCKRENDSREVSGRGWWKATSHVKKGISSWGANGDQVKGYKRPLTFHRFKDNNRRTRKDAVKTDWIMHEYSLQSTPTEWRLCKIKYKGKEKKVKEYMTSLENNNTTRTPSMSVEGEDGSSCSSISMNMTPIHMEQPPPSAVNNNNNNNNVNYYDSSNMMFHDDYQFLQLDDILDQSFSDIWSWDTSY